MNCKNCGTTIPDEGIFCPNCGISTQLDQQSQNTVLNSKNEYNQINTYQSSQKKKSTTLLLCVFLGYLGFHKFYVGKILSGVIYFFTIGIFGIGWFIDIIKILTNKFTDSQGRIITDNYTTIHKNSSMIKNIATNIYYSIKNRRLNLPKDCNIAFFKNGKLYDVQPRNITISLYENRDVAYHADFIVLDSMVYNLHNVDDIKNIKTPSFCDDSGVTSSLDYILRMCASNVRNNGDNERSIIILEKAIEIMAHSNSFGTEKDYLRIVAWLYEDGKFDKADNYEKLILNYLENQSKANSQFVQENLFKQPTDLIVFDSYSGVCCKTCAIYSGRVFSTSGTNKKFPKLPLELKNDTSEHIGCATSVSAYYEGTEVCYRGKYYNAEYISKRPFVDERTTEEIDIYEQGIQETNKEQIKFENLKEYYRILYALPNIAPKSLAAYVRCKNSNTAKFQQIKEAALKCNIVIK